MAVTTGATKSRLSSVASGDSVQRLLALGALVILLAFFSVISTPFRTPDNYISILVATAVNGVLAMGVTFVIITGGIDLSVGTTMTFASVCMGLVVTNAGLPLWMGIPAALLAGMAVGLVNGLLIAKAKLPYNVVDVVLEEGVHSLRGEPNVIDVRNCAAAAAFELSPLPGQPGLRAIRLFEDALKRGLLVRFTGDTIALAPPAISTADEIQRLVEGLRASIRAVA